MKFTVEDVTKHHASRIEPKDIYATLWRCRDFELSHLWQRSVFLTAFLVLAYTGYGSCVFTQVGLDTRLSDGTYTTIAVMGLLILFIGMLLSQLWIMMGKASKAWYERYEHAIYNLEHDNHFTMTVVTETMCEKEMMHGDLPLPSPCDRNLFSTNAGAFSPSRINIFIGQLSWLLLFVAYIAHTVLSLLSGRVMTFGFKPCCIALYAIIIVFLLNVVSYLLIRGIVSSNTLQGD